MSDILWGLASSLIALVPALALMAQQSHWLQMRIHCAVFALAWNWRYRVGIGAL